MKFTTDIQGLETDDPLTVLWHHLGQRFHLFSYHLWIGTNVFFNLLFNQE